MSAYIYNSRTGERIGEVEYIDESRYENACDNPEGHVRADDVLDDSDLEQLGIDGSFTIFATVK